jgi:hypothetical protein
MVGKMEGRTMLFVIVEDLLDGDDTWVIVTLIVLSGRLLVPIENSANERGNQSDTSFGTSNGLRKSEEQSQIAVDLIVTLELASSLNSLPCRSNLNQDTVPWNANTGIECNEFPRLCLGSFFIKG